MTDRCDECNAEAPAHYGSCSKVPPEMRAAFADIDREAEERRTARQDWRSSELSVPARQQGKTLALAKERVRRVAEGGTINGTYRMSPEPALDAFRADLLLLVGACP